MFAWRGEVEGFSRPAVEAGGDCVEIGLAEGGERHAFGEILTQQAVGVVVRAASSQRVRIGEENPHAGRQRQPLMLGRFLALVAGQRFAQRRRDGVQRAGERTGRNIGFARWHEDKHNKARAALY